MPHMFWGDEDDVPSQDLPHVVEVQEEGGSVLVWTGDEVLSPAQRADFVFGPIGMLMGAASFAFVIAILVVGAGFALYHILHHVIR